MSKKQGQIWKVDVIVGPTLCYLALLLIPVTQRDSIKTGERENEGEWAIFRKRAFSFFFSLPALFLPFHLVKRFMMSFLQRHAVLK